MIRSHWIGMASLLALAGAAPAAITLTYSSSAPTYANTLNFDEAGGPTGLVGQNAFAGVGISNMQSGAGDNPFIGPGTVIGAPFVGTGNAWIGNNFGAFLTFSSNITEFSAQYWDDSGPGTFIGGGAAVVALDHGTEVGSLAVTDPTYQATGPTWVNITTTAGTSFDQIVFLSNGFTNHAASLDNLSWTVPAPSSAALLGLTGLLGARRRRAR
jgi:hypothetical protein